MKTNGLLLTSATLGLVSLAVQFPVVATGLVVVMSCSIGGFCIGQKIAKWLVK